MKNKLMCHVVAGYPSQKECIELLLGMQKTGIKTIEVQIPFSDPIADGETIMKANDRAIENDMTTKKSFELLKKARDSGLKADVYIMSYLQKVLSCGIEDFCIQAQSVNAKGLIIPDLPVDTEEYKLLRKAADRYGLEIVPVVSPGADIDRLGEVIKHAGDLIYLTSIKGITGNKLKLSASLKDLAKIVKNLKPDSKLAVGFGIQTKEDVKEVLDIADIAVLGSSVIRRIDRSGVKNSLEFLTTLLR